MRLRPLTEAECYARCYGGRREESVSVVFEESYAHEPSRQAVSDRGEARSGREATAEREAA